MNTITATTILDETIISQIVDFSYTTSDNWYLIDDSFTAYMIDKFNGKPAAEMITEEAINEFNNWNN